jgi:putative GTP pyrophosphokinase
LANTYSEEELNQTIQRILREEYIDAYDDLTALFEPLGQYKEIVDRVEWRLKNVESIKEKMVRKGIGLEQLREEISDIIGFRIIIHFLSDVPNIIALLRELPGIELNTDQQFEDYIAKPQATGYRSLHINALYWQEERDSHVPFEIQIRTALQHAWAAKSHLLVYKVEEISERWQKHFRILSDQLHLADEVADLLRSELNSEAAGRV